MEDPRLSVVIPAYNNGYQLDTVLDSLTRQTLPTGHFEVVVGDDGSTDPLAPLVDRYADRLDIRCVRAEENRGRSANRNAGAAQARADVLMFLDSDTVAHPELLARHVAFHAHRQRPGVLLGQRYDIDWAGADALRRGEAVTAAMVDAERGDPRFEDLALAQRWQDFPRAPWILGLTHNASIDRDSFVRAGGFDEEMVRWGMEDTEFFYRVFRLHGMAPDVFELDAQAVAYHLPHFRETTNGFANMDNMKHVMRKHPRYDVEALYAMRTFGRYLSRVRIYGDSLEACRRLGLGRPEAIPAVIREQLSRQVGLVVGFGVSELDLGAGSTTFDHDAPLSPTNSHLLGLVLQQFRAAQLDLIVSVDVWRFFLPDDLSTFLVRALRKTDQLELVATRSEVDQMAILPAPFIADLDYLAQMLRPRFKVAVTEHDRATVLSIR